MSVSIVVARVATCAHRIIDEIVRAEPHFVLKGRTNCPKNALRLVKRVRPDLLLLSFDLPDRKALDTIRAAKRCASTRVVTVGFENRFDDAVSFIEAGADAHLFANSSVADAMRVLESTTAENQYGNPAA